MGWLVQRIFIPALPYSQHAATIYVTHDQSEALAISDTGVLLRQGVIEQMGSPVELCEEPWLRFAADFVGEMNCFGAQVTGKPADRLEVNILGRSTSIPRPAWYQDATAIDVICRPEALNVLDADDAAGWGQGRVAIIYKCLCSCTGGCK